MLRGVPGDVSMFRISSKNKLRRYLVAGLSLAAFAIFVLSSSHRTSAQEPKKMASAQVAGGGDQVARGKYIVEDVAMCGTCHTPRLANGELDRSRWLAGAPVPYLPAQPTPGLAYPGASAGGRAAGNGFRNDYAADHRNLDQRPAAARSHAEVSHDARGCGGGSGLSEVAEIAGNF